jgi:ATP-dependent exoDNAse (exonuclease V) beta subunit
LHRDRIHRQWLPSELQAVCENAERRRLIDSLCKLYVAMTRAERVLQMFIDPDKRPLPRVTDTSASTPQWTAERLLRSVLTDGGPVPPETRLYAAGQIDWPHPSVPAGTAGAAPGPRRHAPPAASDEDRAPLCLAPLSDGRRRGRRRVAPSSLRRESQKVADEFVLAASTGADRGTLWHRWCQSIEFLDAGLPDRRVLRQQALQLDVDPDTIDDSVELFLAALQRPGVRRVFSRREYQPPRRGPWPADVLSELSAGPMEIEVLRERRFLVPEAGTLLSGAIDRLVLLSRDDRVLAADVLDFKTDASPPRGSSARAQMLRARYGEQLASYARAVRQMYDLPRERLAARIVWLSTGRVERFVSS